MFALLGGNLSLVDGFRFDLASVMGRTPTRFAGMRRCSPRLKRVLCYINGQADLNRGILAGRLSGREFSATVCRVERHFRDAVRRFWLPRNLTTGNLPVVFAAPAMCLNAMAARPAPLSICFHGA
ncbi:hypothetical protein KCP77_03710 [Salmonella enterica subsp. enterica]|nr:hypothetical protein KCP77_03710 [Salmonella enterica subsp. enterica]